MKKACGAMVEVRGAIPVFRVEDVTLKDTVLQGKNTHWRVTSMNKTDISTLAKFLLFSGDSNNTVSYCIIIIL